MVWLYDMCRIVGYFLGGASVVSFVGCIYCLVGGASFFVDWALLSAFSCDMTMTVLCDWMSFGFLSFVLFISSNVMLYRVDYMGGDRFKSRFCLMVLMFVFSMVFLILSPNLVRILLGWDGLGLVSYGLVIYYQNPRSFNAGMITVLSNRVGDVAILLAISLMLGWGDWGVSSFSDLGGEGFILILWLCLLAAMTKSAQIPFSAWLPAAMAAPTPVSALVHSSTLVTAGVYLMIRFSSCFDGGVMFFFDVGFLCYHIYGGHWGKF